MIARRWRSCFAPGQAREPTLRAAPALASGKRRNGTRPTQGKILMSLKQGKTLTGYKLQSLDGELGTAKDFYFDDHSWTIRIWWPTTG